MNCKNARKITFLSEYPEIVNSELVEAKRHIKECQDCKAFFEGDRAFGSMLRNTIRKDKAPEVFKSRIINTKKKKSLKGLYQGLAIAASILLLVVAGIYLFSIQKESPAIIGQIVNDHIQFLPSTNIQIISSNPEEIKRWFKGKVDFSVNIPDMRARLNGGRLCFLNKKRQALLFYEHSGFPISLFIVDDVDPKKIDADKEVMVKGRKLFLLEDRGYNLLLWQDKGLTYTLVSELPMDEIKKLIMN